MIFYSRARMAVELIKRENRLCASPTEYVSVVVLK